MVRAESTEVTRLGKYEILAEVAAGGMASVYVARHAGAPDTAPRMERLVAIKRVHPHLLKMPQFREMFQDEARVASLIRHANVVRLLDIGDAEGELYLVLEYVESASLAVLLREAAAAGNRVPPAVASRIVADLLLGLHAAHETRDARGRALEVVHRDVSPQNVLVGIDGVSQVIDFGIAKASSRLSETTGGAIKGKLAYMSPEQAKGAILDRRSDVFSAGIVLFEALTGKRLFGDASGSNVLINVLLETIEPPSQVAPGVPAEVDPVVERALERVRDERYQTALELHDALVAAIPPASAGDVAKELDRYCGPTIGRRRDETRRALESIDGARSPDGFLPVAVSPVERPAPTGMAAAYDDTRAPSRSRAAVWIGLSALVSAAAVAATRHYDRAASMPQPPEAPMAQTVATRDASTGSSTPDPSLATDAAALPPPPSTSEPSSRPTRVVKRPKTTGVPSSRPVPPPASSANLAKPADLHPENPY